MRVPFAVILSFVSLCVSCDSSSQKNTPSQLASTPSAGASSMTGGDMASDSLETDMTMTTSAVDDHLGGIGENMGGALMAESLPIPRQRSPLPELESPRVAIIDGPGTISIQPSLAFGDDGRLGIAWCGRTDDDLGIFFTVYGANEKPQMAPIVANTTAQGIQNEPAVCGLVGGGYVVAWSEDSQLTPPNLGIRYRRFDAQGHPIDEVDQNVMTDEPSNHWLAQLDCHPQGGFAITGVFGESNNTFGVFVQRYNLDGVRKGSPVIVNQAPEGTQAYPTVTHTLDGSLVVCYEDNLDDGTPGRVHCRMIGPEEELATHPIVEIATPDEELKGPHVIPMNDDGDVLIAATHDQRRIRLYQTNGREPVKTLEGPDEPVAYFGVMAPGANNEAVLMYMAGSGASTQIKLLTINQQAPSQLSVTLPSERVAPYQPSVVHYRGRTAAAWTERRDDTGFRIKLAIFGSDNATVGGP